MSKISKIVAALYRKYSDEINVNDILKKNVISRRKKIISIAALVIILFFVYFFALKIGFYQSQSEAGKALIRTTFRHYVGCWECTSVKEEGDQITIRFRMKKKIFGNKNLDKYADSIYAIYNVVKNDFLAKEKWSGYSVNFNFYDGSSLPYYFHLCYVDKDELNMEIQMKWLGLMEMRDIAKNFSSTKRLDIFYVSDNITDGLDQFDNLDFLSYYYITDDEKEYVWSIFPDCIIECKDGTCVNE